MMDIVSFLIFFIYAVLIFLILIYISPIFSALIMILIPIVFVYLLPGQTIQFFSAKQFSFVGGAVIQNIHILLLIWSVLIGVIGYTTLLSWYLLGEKKPKPKQEIQEPAADIKPVPVEGPTAQVKEAHAPGSKKTRWPIFWRREEKISISPEEKQIIEREAIPQKGEPKTEPPQKEALERPETKPPELAKKRTKWPIFWRKEEKISISPEEKQIIEREAILQKGEPKTEVPEKEALERPETKPLEPAKKRGKRLKAKTEVPEKEALERPETKPLEPAKKRGKRLKAKSIAEELKTEAPQKEAQSETKLPEPKKRGKRQKAKSIAEEPKQEIISISNLI